MAVRRWNLILGTAALALALAASAALGQAARSACRGDVQKLCKGVTAGAGRIRDCLEQHAAMLSAECKQDLAAHPRKKVTPGAASAPAKSWGGACMLDISNYCKDIPKGGGQVRACLERRMDGLTPDCRAALQAKKGK